MTELPRLRSLLLLVVLAATVAACGFEPRVQKPTGFDTGVSLSQNVDDFVLARVADDYPAFAVLVLQDGARVVKSSYGRVRRDQPDEATASTPFYLADLSMQFTAVAVLMLCEDGALSLETTATDVVPGLPDEWSSITVHDLLANESGLPDYTTELDSLDVDPTNDMVLEAASTARLRFPAGTGFEVSRTGYVLLAEIVEEVSGQAFADFVQERIFDALGMSGSAVVDETGPEVAGHAVGYASLDSIADYEGRSTGDAGVFSTLDDMEAWLRALDGHTLLAPAVAAPMYATDGPDRYGYGWYGGSWNDTPAYYLQGAEAGFRSFIGRVPDEDISYVVLAAGRYDWTFDLPGLFLGYLLGF